MKKLMISVLLIFAGSLQALPIGNPIEASYFNDGIFFHHYDDVYCLNWCDCFNFRTGFYGDYVFNRHLEINAVSESGDIQTTQINTNAGYLAVSFFDILEVFGTVGASRIELEADPTNWGIFNIPSMATLRFQTTFSWSIGTRATILDWRCVGIGVEGQYFYTNPNYDSFTNGDGVIVSLDQENATYQEWQVGAAICLNLTEKFDMFSVIPYAGVKWANAKFDLNNVLVLDGAFSNLKAKKHWGYAIGLTFVLCEKISATVEGRFADEKAVYANTQWRF